MTQTEEDKYVRRLVVKGWPEKLAKRVVEGVVPGQLKPPGHVRINKSDMRDIPSRPPITPQES